MISKFLQTQRSDWKKIAKMSGCKNPGSKRFQRLLCSLECFQVVNFLVHENALVTQCVMTQLELHIPIGSVKIFEVHKSISQKT